MNLSSTVEHWIDRLLEHSFIFNLNQVVLDGGKHRPVRRFLRETPRESVIDLGCGPGSWAKLASGRYLGVDTSPSFIAAARNRYADDRDIQFVQADAAEFDGDETYDLALMISVLHHLPDEQAVQTFRRASRYARYLFIMDLYPMPRNPLSRRLYGMDRGNYIREPAAQKQLAAQSRAHRLLKEDDFFSWNRLYRHTMFLFESTA